MQGEIGAAASLHEDLRAAILVDENLPSAGLFGLCHQEVQKHRFAAAGWADNQRMPKIALVEIEEIGAARIGFEQCHRIAPMIAARLSRREGMEGREGREIERGDRRGPGAPCKITDELRPVGGFKRGPFACGDHAGVGKGRARDRHMVAQGFHRIRIDREREVMIAQHKAVRHQVIARIDQRIGLADRAVARILHLGHAQPELLGRRRPPKKSEGLRQHEPEIDR